MEAVEESIDRSAIAAWCCCCCWCCWWWWCLIAAAWAIASEAAVETGGGERRLQGIPEVATSARDQIRGFSLTTAGLSTVGLAVLMPHELLLRLLLLSGCCCCCCCGCCCWGRLSVSIASDALELSGRYRCTDDMSEFKSAKGFCANVVSAVLRMFRLSRFRNESWNGIWGCESSLPETKHKKH